MCVLPPAGWGGLGFTSPRHQNPIPLPAAMTAHTRAGPCASQTTTPGKGDRARARDSASDNYSLQSSVMADSATPWAAARRASLSITDSQSLLKPMSTESVMPSDRLVLCCPLLLPSIFPSIRVFSNESVLHIRWPKYWSFSISPFNEYSGLISFRID